MRAEQRIRRRIREALAPLRPARAIGLLQSMLKTVRRAARAQAKREAASRERGY